MEYRAVKGGIRDIDEGKRTVLVTFPWEVLDSYKTDFAREAFDEGLRAQLPIMVWQHQKIEPIGRAIEWQKTRSANELLARFSDFDAVPRARQAFVQLADEDITDFSYGFDRAKATAHPTQRDALRFREARMREISPVSVGSIPGAIALGVRAVDDLGAIATLVREQAITGEQAREMLSLAALAHDIDPSPRERIEVLEHLLDDGERAVTITMGPGGQITVDGGSSDDATPDPTAAPVVDDTTPDLSDDVVQLLQAVDASLDAACSLVDANDTSTLPAWAQQSLALMGAASVASDALLDELDIPDPDQADDADDDPADTVDDGGRDDDAEGERAAVSDKPWSEVSQADYTLEQYARACLLVKNGGGTKDDCALPVREPDGTLNRNAVHAAAGRIGQVKGFDSTAISAAKAKLRSLYSEIGETAPDGLRAPSPADVRMALLTRRA